MGGYCAIYCPRVLGKYQNLVFRQERLHFIFLFLLLFSGYTLTGFRLAYDWYLNAKLDARKKRKRFQQKRDQLSTCIADYIYPEFAIHERMMKKLELTRTIRALRRGLMSTVGRGEYIHQLENYLSGSSEDRVARREVIIYNFTRTFSRVYYFRISA